MDATDTTWTANPTALGAEYTDQHGMATQIVGNKYTHSLRVSHRYRDDNGWTQGYVLSARFDGSLADFRRTVASYREHGDATTPIIGGGTVTRGV